MVRHSGTAPLASSRSVGAVFAGDFQTSRGTALALWASTVNTRKVLADFAVCDW